MTEEKPKKSTITLTFDHETLKLVIDGKCHNNDVALNMLAQAEREMRFQWNFERTMRQQAEMMNDARVQQMLQNAHRVKA